MAGNKILDAVMSQWMRAVDPVKALTGSTGQEIARDAPRSRFASLSRKGRRSDLPQHALATARMAKRVGPLALPVGVAKEVVTGVGSMARGGKFLGEQGFSPSDLQANLTGYLLGEGRKKGSKVRAGVQAAHDQKAKDAKHFILGQIKDEMRAKTEIPIDGDSGVM